MKVKVEMPDGTSAEDIITLNTDPETCMFDNGINAAEMFWNKLPLENIKMDCGSDTDAFSQNIIFENLGVQDKHMCSYGYNIAITSDGKLFTTCNQGVWGALVSKYYDDSLIRDPNIEEGRNISRLVYENFWKFEETGFTYTLTITKA